MKKLCIPYVCNVFFKCRWRNKGQVRCSSYFVYGPKVAAHKGGKIAGDAREKLEIETEAKVVSTGNYLAEPEGKKRLD